MKYQTPLEPTTPTDLSAFEKNRRISLPASYREFLLEGNGGYGPEPSFLDIPNWTRTSLQTIFGLTGIEAKSIHRTELGNFSPEIERQFLQIALDPGGEVFVLDLRPTTYGRVYVRAHDSPPNRPPIIDDTGFSEWDYEEAELYHHVASSFEEFLGMLRAEPEDA